jgi:hypothetical protein
MKKALSLVPKLSPRIFFIDMNCAVVGCASGKNEASFLQYIGNGMYSLSKTDAVNILDLDEFDDDNEVLGATKTDGSVLARTDIEDMKVDDPVGLGVGIPSKELPLPKGTHTSVSFPLFVLDLHLNTLLAHWQWEGSPTVHLRRRRMVADKRIVKLLKKETTLIGRWGWIGG